jgi:hypothetical protein
VHGINAPGVIPFEQIADYYSGTEKPVFLHAAEKGDAAGVAKRLKKMDFVCHMILSPFEKAGAVPGRYLVYKNLLSVTETFVPLVIAGHLSRIFWKAP